jgi:two-component system, OmpR family, sensor histidine kinase VicK
MSIEDNSLQVIKDIGKLSADGILVYDFEQAHVKYCNERLFSILGISSKEVNTGGIPALRKTINEPDKFLVDQFESLKQKHRVSGVEMRIGIKDDSYVVCDAYYIQAPEIVIAFIKDVSRSKEHFNYIAEFGARKDTILDMVSHNLSGPLNLTNNLLDRVDQLSRQVPKNIGEYSRLIRENTQQCIEIIHSFLKQEHFTSERMPVEPNRFDVIAKINIVVEYYRQFAEKKKITVVTESRELFVTGDDVKFFQIVNNLLSNAIKFTEEKGKIMVLVEEFEKGFKVSIKDNGIGIPEYYHPHLFKKNTPAGRPGLRGEKSIGMGLYIVKKLVTLMNGNISFETAENSGSTFHVVLPK